MACVEPRSDGLVSHTYRACSKDNLTSPQYLVWCTRLDRRRVCLPHDPRHLAIFRHKTVIDQGDCYGRHCQLPDRFHPILGRISSFHLVPRPQSPPSLHGQGCRSTYSRYRLPDLGSRQSWRSRRDYPSTRQSSR
jgi:hypothetical protein